MPLKAMGHGDEIVIADANFPAASTAAALGAHLIDMSGHKGAAVVAAILKLFPLDQYVEQPAAVMRRVPNDEAKDLPVPIWKEYQKLLNEAERKDIQIEQVERFEFYKRAQNAFAVVATGEGALYANLILKKGVLPDEE